MKQVTHSSILLSVSAALIALTGVCFVGGGIWLGMLGGSWYYAAAGTALLLTAGLLASARPLALWVYALLLAATAGWSLWETGLNWWGLAARGDVLFLFGLLLVTPWIVRRLRRVVSGTGEVEYRPDWGGGRGLLGLVLVVYFGLAVVSWFVACLSGCHTHPLDVVSRDFAA